MIWRSDWFSSYFYWEDEPSRSKVAQGDDGLAMRVFSIGRFRCQEIFNLGWDHVGWIVTGLLCQTSWYGIWWNGWQLAKPVWILTMIDSWNVNSRGLSAFMRHRMIIMLLNADSSEGRKKRKIIHFKLQNPDWKAMRVVELSDDRRQRELPKKRPLIKMERWAKD